MMPCYIISETHSLDITFYFMVLRDATLCLTLLCHNIDAMLQYTTACYINYMTLLLGYTTLCYAMLCYTLLHYCIMIYATSYIMHSIA